MTRHNQSRSKNRSAEDVGLHIAPTVIIRYDKGFPGIMRRRLDLWDPATRRHARNLAPETSPGFASIPCQLNISIVGSHPKRSLFFGRGLDGENGAMGFGAGDISRKSAGILKRGDLNRIVGGKVGRDKIPA